MGFQKVYDLSSRVIPDGIRADDPHDHETFVDWACDAALDRQGFATSGKLAAYWASVNAAEAKAWCQAHIGDDLIEVLV